MKRTSQLLLFASVVVWNFIRADGQACGATLGGCPIGLVCALGICVVAGGQQCNGINVFCNNGLLCVGNTCVLFTGGQGDPILRGFDGVEWEFLGQPGNHYALYSDAAHQVNMRLIEGKMHDHTGTYIDAMGFRVANHNVSIELTAAGNLNVDIDGERNFVRADPVEGRKKLTAGAGSIIVDWGSYVPDFGKAVTVQTDVLQLKVWAVPAGTLDEGGIEQPAYLNFRAALLSAPVGNDVQGLVGETLDKITPAVAESKNATTKSKIVEFKGRGAEEDYETGGLFDPFFKFSVFGKKKPSQLVQLRRLKRDRPFDNLAFPLVACSNC